jgi:hypothetical protein
MKPCRLFWPKPTRPVRVVAEYAAEDLADLRHQFKPLAEHYRRRFNRAQCGFAVFVIGWMLAGIF